MKFLFLVSCILTANLVLCNGFEVSLKEKKDAAFYWKFPQNYPFHYFTSISAIPTAFLPVQLNTTTERKGLWVLRYKDFSSLPLVYSLGGSGHVSTITYSAHAQLFDSITITALLYGGAELDLVVNPKPSNWNRINLGNYLEPCSTSNSTKDEDNDPNLTWITFKFDMNRADEMQLEAKIHHPQSFLIIDEITVSYFLEEKSKVNSSDFKEIKEHNITRLRCKKDQAD